MIVMRVLACETGDGSTSMRRRHIFGIPYDGSLPTLGMYRQRGHALYRQRGRALQGSALHGTAKGQKQKSRRRQPCKRSRAIPNPERPANPERIPSGQALHAGVCRPGKGRTPKLGSGTDSAIRYTS